MHNCRMRLFFLLGLAAAVTASAQNYNNPVLRGINNGVRMAEQIRSAEALRETAETLKVERERIRESAETLRVERDRIRAETELLREETLQLREQRRASETTSDTISDPDRKDIIAQAIVEIGAAYGDVMPYIDRMLYFQEILLKAPAALQEDQLYSFVLGLYLLARFVDDREFRTSLVSSRLPEPEPDPPPVPEQRAVLEP